jgi:hypothetical protein
LSTVKAIGVAPGMSELAAPKILKIFVVGLKVQEIPEFIPRVPIHVGVVDVIKSPGLTADGFGL